MVDAHSKWVEVQEMSSTTVGETMQELRHMFARYGFPEQLVSDNGPQFVTGKLDEFMRQNGVKPMKYETADAPSYGVGAVL